MSDKIQTIVQIGVYTNAEYLQLVDPIKYPPELCGKLPIDFPQLHNGRWNYIGIDMGAYSIERCRKKYEPSADIKFMQRLIYDDDIEVEHDGYRVGAMGGIVQPSISLDTLINKELSLRPTLLALDIEGSELPILKGYSWYVKPRLIVIEMHRSVDIDEIHSILTKNGYLLQAVAYQSDALNVAYERIKNSVNQAKRVPFHITSARP